MPNAVSPRLSARPATSARGRLNVAQCRVFLGVRRSHLDPERPEPLHPRVRRRAPVQPRGPETAAAIRRRELGANRPGDQQRRAGDLPLPDPLRDRVRTHRQHVGLHTVHGIDARWPTIRHRVGQRTDHQQDERGSAGRLQATAPDRGRRGLQRAVRKLSTPSSGHAQPAGRRSRAVTGPARPAARWRDRSAPRPDTVGLGRRRGGQPGLIASLGFRLIQGGVGALHRVVGRFVNRFDGDTG